MNREGMKLATLCSGIGAPEVAAKRLGWECLWSAEVDPKASAVLAHHHPESVNLGDITKIDGRELERPDVLVFGTPCQSFSVAGKRAGMDDARGVLAFVALGIVGRVRPTWFILENVPGLLSSNAGRDFGAFLRAVDELGYSGAWASPDAQFFGLAQRRERVFFVGHIGDWRYPASVLSQFSRLCGHPAPSREKGEDVAASLASSAGGCNDPNRAGAFIHPIGIDEIAPPLTHNPYGDHESREGLLVMAHGQGNAEIVSDGSPSLTCNHEAPIVFDPNQVTSPGNYSNPKAGDPCHPLVSAAPPMMAFYPTEGYHFGVFDDVSPAVKVGSGGHSGNPPAIAHGFLPGQGAGAGSIGYEKELGPTLRSGCNQYGVLQVPVAGFYPTAGREFPEYEEQSPSVKVGSGIGIPSPPGVRIGMSVRRLLPVECEALQGFERNYTLIPYKGKPMADGSRYKMLGNSMAIPVIQWILRRIQELDSVPRNDQSGQVLSEKENTQSSQGNGEQ